MTQCFRPLAPSDDELLRHALDGEPLSVAANEHLEHCSFCQERLVSYTSTNSFLVSRLYRSQCPDATTLSHYCTGMLSLDEAMRVAQHLELCPLCTNEVAETRLLLATFEPFPEEHVNDTPSPHVTTPHIIASLLPWQPQSIVWNGGDYAREQQWPREYRADMISISLHLARNQQGALLLLGLVSSTAGAEPVDLLHGTKIELYQVHDFTFSSSSAFKNDSQDTISPAGQGLCLSTSVDELGRFVLQPVPPGRYLMIIYLAEAEVVIEELNVHLSCSKKNDEAG